MKRKNLLALLTAACLLAAALTGCGGSAKNTEAHQYAMDSAAPMDAPAAEEMEVLYSSADTAMGSAETSVEQKLITRVSINAETEDLDAFVENLNGKIAALGGYIEYQDIYNGSAYASRRYRNANMTIRIPADKLAGFVEQVKGSSNVVSYNESQENVTLTYVATESRMKALETEQARLLELMEKAETMSDLLEIEARLTEVRYELERVTSQLLVLSNQVDYATVDLNIEQVTVYTEVEEQTVWQRISSGFTGNLKDLGDNLVDLFVTVVTYSPQLVFAAAVILVIILLARRSLRKHRVKKESTLPQQPENPET